ncbi:hypothetical protein PspLS_08336 [Pyricularia sp. CBS 133598]|nr:hypothetical protein PspLS_08336 [Pyricularia sp. CBS 133598]
MGVEHELVVVDEFDALSIELKRPNDSSSPSSSRAALTEKYPAKTHARKVADKLGVDKGLIYLQGKPTTTYEDSDMEPPFRQRRYFYYMSGADFPNAHLTYDVATDQLLLWIPTRKPREELYLGRIPDREDCMSRLDVDDCRDVVQMTRFIAAHLKHHPGTTLFLLHSDQAPGLDDLPVQYAGRRLDIGRLRLAVDAARVTKTAFEIRQIRRANQVSSEAHRAVLRQIRHLRTEADVEAVFVAACRVRGARSQAYNPIAGAGANAATLHYVDNAAPLKGKQTLVLDAGCEWDCYASDITRTMPAAGRKFSPEAQTIYRIVEKMQNACIDLVRPGVSYLFIQATAQLVAIEEFLKIGLLVGDKAKIMASRVVSAFFPHGLGHHVGLETHDVRSERLLGYDKSSAPLWLGKRLVMSVEQCDRVAELMVSSRQQGADARDALAEGMVITIEPGIYFNRQYIEAFCSDVPERDSFINKSVLDRYYPVGGVRIEDDILVTADGYENLTTAPKGEEALRIINGDDVEADAVLV